MKYEKPLIVETNDAVSVIRGGKENGGTDSLSTDHMSIPAYQADE
jgi:hypothetical protein